MDVISCDKIVKKFGNYTALNSISLNVPEGSIYGLLGPNGAGKTTLIRIINQITIPDSGKVFLMEKEVQPDDVLKIGYLPEERGLYKKMKVGEQALYLARLKGMSKADATLELKKWFVKFGIQDWWDKKIQELSKGMAQKVQFITTVLHRPKLLILDEPFSGFDPINVQLIRNEILRMKNEGTSIILSTHNMASVEELCDNITLINKSNLIVSGGVDDIRKQHGKNQIEVIYKGVNPADFTVSNLFKVNGDNEYKGMRRVVLELEKKETTNIILGEVMKCTDSLVSYQELMPSMNDIFIKLVKES